MMTDTAENKEAGHSSGKGVQRHVPLILLIILCGCLLISSIGLSIKLLLVYKDCNNANMPPLDPRRVIDVPLQFSNNSELNSKLLSVMETILRNSTWALRRSQTALKRGHEQQDGYKKSINGLQNTLTRCNVDLRQVREKLQVTEEQVRIMTYSSNVAEMKLLNMQEELSKIEEDLSGENSATKRLF